MRIKEDKTNWKASNVLRKIAEVPEEPIMRSKKSTRKWCKGKQGVKHIYILIERHDESYFHYKKYRCSGCGKIKYS